MISGATMLALWLGLAVLVVLLALLVQVRNLVASLDRIERRQRSASELAFEREVEQYTRRVQADWDSARKREREQTKRAAAWRTRDYAVAALGVACAAGYLAGVVAPW